MMETRIAWDRHAKIDKISATLAIENAFKANPQDMKNGNFYLEAPNLSSPHQL